MSQNIIDTEADGGDVLDPESFTEADRADFAKAFTEAGRPEVPLIEVPNPGVTTLSYGVEIDGERRKLVTVRELNGSDEEALARLDPTKGDQYYVLLMDLIIKRATESIGGVVPTPSDLGRLLMGDRDVIFLEIILATTGEEKEYEDVKCPECGETFNAHVGIRGVVEIHRLEEDGEPATDVVLRDGAVVHLRYPTGEDQMSLFQGKEVAKKNTSERNTLLLGRCIDTVDGKTIRNAVEYARNLGMADRRTLVDALGDGPRVEFKEVEVPCPECGSELPFKLSWADLLFI
jgi:DNA-directed RNA polymerase subunit RPC12/RpoP